MAGPICPAGHGEAAHLARVRLWRASCVRCGTCPAAGIGSRCACAACLVAGWIALRVTDRPGLSLGARIVAVCPWCMTWADRIRLLLRLARPLEDVGWVSTRAR